MTILDEPAPRAVGWVCPHCENGVHRDSADSHLNTCQQKPPATGGDPAERTLDQLRAAETAFNERHPNLFPKP